MAKIGAAVAALLVLSGCTTASPSPPVPTTTEVIMFAIHNVDAKGAVGSSATDEWPSDLGDVRIAYPSTLDFAFAECVKDAGYSDYSVDYFGTLVVKGPTGVESEIERGVRHNCDFRHQLEWSRTALLTSQEREYVYDYYRQWLVPCLAVAGYSIHGAPSRQKFISDWLTPGWWSPYDSIEPEPGAAERSDLQKKCAPMPVAFQDRLNG